MRVLDPKCHIYVPSTGRHDYPRQLKGTYKYLDPEFARKNVTYVVYESELAAYSVTHPNVSIAVVRDDQPKGIAHKRYLIGQLAEKDGYDSFIMLDDDLKFYIRDESFAGKLAPATQQDTIDCLALVSEMLQSYVLAGVAQRFNFPYVRVTDRPPFGLAYKNSRLNRAFGFQTKFFNEELLHNRIVMMSDFDYMLQTMGLGKESIQTFEYAQDQGSSQAPGGCSTYRTLELQAESARKLAEIHPRWVTVVNKEVKAGGDYGTRVDVRINWTAFRSFMGFEL